MVEVKAGEEQNEQISDQFQVPCEEKGCLIQYSIEDDIRINPAPNKRLYGVTSSSQREHSKRTKHIKPIDIPFKILCPTCIDMKPLKSIPKGNPVVSKSQECAVGMDTGQIYVFDPILEEKSMFKKHQLTTTKLIDENILEKHKPVDMVRWVSLISDYFVAIFQDYSMYGFWNKVENLNNKNREQVERVVGDMRKVEGTNRIRPHHSSNKGEKIGDLHSEEGVTYHQNLLNDEMGDFSVAINTRHPEINPQCIWQFYYKKMNDIRFSGVPGKEGEIYMAIAASDPYLRIFDYGRQSLLGVFRSYYGECLCLEFSADGILLAAGFQDDSIAIINIPLMQIMCRCEGHNSFISALRFDSYFYESLNSPVDLEEGKVEKEEEESEAHKNVDIEMVCGGSEIEARHKEMDFNYKDIGPDQILAAIQQQGRAQGEGAMDQGQGSVGIKNRVYRLVSGSFDTKICFWNIPLDTLIEENNIKRVRASKQIPDAMGISKLHEYPHLSTITILNPVSSPKVHNFPVLTLEVVESNVITFSQSWNIKIYKPEITKREVDFEFGKKQDKPEVEGNYEDDLSEGSMGEKDAPLKQNKFHPNDISSKNPEIIDIHLTSSKEKEKMGMKNKRRGSEEGYSNLSHGPSALGSYQLEGNRGRESKRASTTFKPTPTKPSARSLGRSEERVRGKNPKNPRLEEDLWTGASFMHSDTALVQSKSRITGGKRDNYMDPHGGDAGEGLLTNDPPPKAQGKRGGKRKGRGHSEKEKAVRMEKSPGEPGPPELQAEDVNLGRWVDGGGVRIDPYAENEKRMSHGVLVTSNRNVGLQNSQNTPNTQNTQNIKKGKNQTPGYMAATKAMPTVDNTHIRSSPKGNHPKGTKKQDLENTTRTSPPHKIGKGERAAKVEKEPTADQIEKVEKKEKIEEKKEKLENKEGGKVVEKEDLGKSKVDNSEKLSENKNEDVDKQNEEKKEERKTTHKATKRSKRPAEPVVALRDERMKNVLEDRPRYKYKVGKSAEVTQALSGSSNTKSPPAHSQVTKPNQNIQNPPLLDTPLKDSQWENENRHAQTSPKANRRPFEEGKPKVGSSTSKQAMGDMRLGYLRNSTRLQSKKLEHKSPRNTTSKLKHTSSPPSEPPSTKSQKSHNMSTQSHQPTKAGGALDSEPPVDLPKQEFLKRKSKSVLTNLPTISQRPKLEESSFREFLQKKKYEAKSTVRRFKQPGQGTYKGDYKRRSITEETKDSMLQASLDYKGGTQPIGGDMEGDEFVSGDSRGQGNVGNVGNILTQEESSYSWSPKRKAKSMLKHSEESPIAMSNVTRGRGAAALLRSHYPGVGSSIGAYSNNPPPPTLAGKGELSRSVSGTLTSTIERSRSSSKTFHKKSSKMGMRKTGVQGSQHLRVIKIEKKLPEADLGAASLSSTDPNGSKRRISDPNTGDAQETLGENIENIEGERDSSSVLQTNYTAPGEDNIESIQRRNINSLLDEIRKERDLMIKARQRMFKKRSSGNTIPNTNVSGEFQLPYIMTKPPPDYFGSNLPSKMKHNKKRTGGKINQTFL